MICAFINRMLSLCASFEVVIAVALFFTLLAPDRNLMVIILYCQFLRLRYILSPEVKQVCARIDQRIKGAVGSIPVVGTVYEKLSTTLNSVAALPQPGAKEKSRCTIMQSTVRSKKHFSCDCEGEYCLVRVFSIPLIWSLGYPNLSQLPKCTSRDIKQLVAGT